MPGWWMLDESHCLSGCSTENKLPLLLVTVCSHLVGHYTNCTSLAYLAVLSVGGHITGLAGIPYYLLYELPAKIFWTDHLEC